MTAPTVFISYSHADEAWKDRLVTHLGVLQREGLLDMWDDRRIEVGTDWRPQIEQAINAASVAVLMVSANFLTSNFILSEEVPRFLQRRQQEGLRIFPVIVSPCAWKKVSWLSRMQIRPKDGKPLSAGNDYEIDADLAAIAEEIASIVKRTAPPMPRLASCRLRPDKGLSPKLPSASSDLFGRENELAALKMVTRRDSAAVIASREAAKQSSTDATEIASQTTLAMTPVELKAQAREHLAKAKALIEQIGYHRRDKEVEEIETM